MIVKWIYSKSNIQFWSNNEKKNEFWSTNRIGVFGFKSAIKEYVPIKSNRIEFYPFQKLSYDFYILLFDIDTRNFISNDVIVLIRITQLMSFQELLWSNGKSMKCQFSFFDAFKWMTNKKLLIVNFCHLSIMNPSFYFVVFLYSMRLCDSMQINCIFSHSKAMWSMCRLVDISSDTMKNCSITEIEIWKKHFHHSDGKDEDEEENQFAYRIEKRNRCGVKGVLSSEKYSTFE